MTEVQKHKERPKLSSKDTARKKARIQTRTKLALAKTPRPNPKKEYIAHVTKLTKTLRGLTFHVARNGHMYFQLSGSPMKLKLSGVTRNPRIFAVTLRHYYKKFEYKEIDKLVTAAHKLLLIMKEVSEYRTEYGYEFAPFYKHQKRVYDDDYTGNYSIHTHLYFARLGRDVRFDNDARYNLLIKSLRDSAGYIFHKDVLKLLNRSYVEMTP